MAHVLLLQTIVDRSSDLTDAMLYKWKERQYLTPNYQKERKIYCNNKKIYIPSSTIIMI